MCILSKRKNYVVISDELVNKFTTAQLKELIKKETHTANTRLKRLEKVGLRDVNPLIQRKWNMYTNTKFGTKKNYFSSNTKKMSRNEILVMYKNVRLFLSGKTTITDTKDTISKHKKNFEMNGLNLSESEVVDILRSYGNSGINTIIGNSEIAFKIITGMVHKGYSERKIIAIINKLENSKKSQWEIMDKLVNESGVQL